MITNYLDQFDNRTHDDDDPIVASCSGGTWGFATPGGAEWTFGQGCNTWLGVESGVATYRREQRPAPPDPLAPGLYTGDSDMYLEGWTTPEDDEPVFSFKFRVPAVIPDGGTSFGSGVRGPWQLEIEVDTDDSTETLNVGVSVSSESGIGGIAVLPSMGSSFIDSSLGSGGVFAKTDWSGGDLYQLEAQYLHNGDLRMRVWRPGIDSVPGWQIEADTGSDYGAYTGDAGQLQLSVYNYDDDELGPGPGIGANANQYAEFDDFSFGMVTEPVESSAIKEDYITVKGQKVLPRLRDRILLSIRASFNDENLYNHALVIATGNKAQTYYGEASDTDPDSPTRISAIGDRVFKYETDLITTQATANKAAKKVFLDNCLVTEDIALEAICNPALEGNDVIGVQELTFSQIQRNFRLQSFTIPLSSSRQNLKVGRVINLQTQTVSVNDDIILVGYEQVIKTTAGTNAVVDVPAGTTDGDLMLLWVALDETASDATPVAVGFSGITGTNKWKKRIAESEGSTKTINWSGSRRGIITLMVYRNVDQSSPIAKLVAGSDTGKAVTIPGMTLGSGEYHLVAAAQSNGVTSYDWPTAWTEMVEADTGGSNTAHLAVSIADRPRIGANPPSFNIDANDNLGQTTYQIALRKDIN